MSGFVVFFSLISLVGLVHLVSLVSLDSFFLHQRAEIAAPVWPGALTKANSAQLEQQKQLK